MAGFIRHPAAERDLGDQAAYLMDHASLEVALRFYEKAVATFEFLARNPGVGLAHISTKPRLAGIRIASVQGFPKHLIFYRPTEDGIEIVRVLHGHRDVDNILESEL